MIEFEDSARAQLLRGAEQIYNAVKTTMGPRGRNVLINDGTLTITHDGVTVAKGINPKPHADTFPGVELIKQAANKMNNSVGDGTTTVTVLTYHLIKEANKLIAAGHNPMVIKKEMNEAVDDVLVSLDKKIEEVGTLKKLTEVAVVSAADKTMGTLIADAVFRLGKDCNITIEEGTAPLEVEYARGFEVGCGLVSPLMALDQSRGETVLDNPHIFVTDKSISSMTEMAPFLETIIKSGNKNLVLVAEDFVGDIIPNLVLNRARGIVSVYAVKVPPFMAGVLEDVSSATGAQIYRTSSGVGFESLDTSLLGSAKKVVINNEKTVIVDGGGDTKQRIRLLETQLRLADSEAVRKRIASLSGAAAIIRVGGATEAEIEEKKFRVEDAVAATKAALSGGIVTGGGVTMLQLSKELQDNTVGKKILKHALSMPFKILMKNSGISPELWVNSVTDSNGIDINNPTKIVNLKKGGIIDPANVIKQSISTAVSTAIAAITTGAIVSEDEDVQEI